MRKATLSSILACTVLAGCPSDDTTGDEVDDTGTETGDGDGDDATESSSSTSTTDDDIDDDTTTDDDVDDDTTDESTDDTTDGPNPICGDGNMDPGEECDDGNGIDTDECTLACTIAICGDMAVQEGVEACDDGNMVDGDGCNALCMIESCGDGIVQGLETCDDGNMVDTDECTNMCLIAACGDAVVQEGVEQCDDGNDVDTDECTTGCITAVCGDMIVQEGVEECDDGNDVDTDECLTACTVAVCGDGVVLAGGMEQCDDGNVDPDDGCSEVCAFESRFAFVTSTLHTGNMGGLLGADAICQARAQAAMLPGTYMAWLSTNEANGTPATRFTQSALPYITVTGIKIADNWADLTDSSIDAALNVTELGGAPPVGTPTCGANSVWTNTLANGTLFSAANSCGNWTSTVGGSHWGQSTAVNNLWTTWCQGGICSWEEPIYCFQQ